MRHRRLCAAFHIERSIANRLGLPEYPCACARCRGGRVRMSQTVVRHHRLFGRDDHLPHPVLTVHGLPLRGPTFTRERGGGNKGALEESEDEVITDETEDEEVRARNLAYDAFGRADSLEREAYAEEGVPHMGADGDEDHLQENEVEFQNTMSECMEPCMWVHGRLECRVASF
ncbi:hypothetical protein M758_N024800 [Ceratodon purpureus]|nr:hypothetical protein M758_N024800 [Ceratodon purpureus]